MARLKSNGTNTSTAPIGFEATALRGSVTFTGEAFLRSLRTTIPPAAGSPQGGVQTGGQWLQISQQLKSKGG